MNKKVLKWIGASIGACVAGIGLVLSATMFVYPAISSIAGLAVAQSSTLWNNVKDAAVGDNVTNGVVLMSLGMFDGTDFDRARGDATNGLDVDVTRLPGSGQTPADDFANPTTFLGTWSLLGVFDGTTWDRWRGGTSPVSSGTELNSINNSAANTVLTITLTGAAGQRIHLYRIAEVGCQVDGTSSYVVNDGATLVYASVAGQVPTIPLTHNNEWEPALTGTAGQDMTIVIQACGAGNTSTAQVYADRF